MDWIIRKLLLGWLALIGALLLMQALPLPKGAVGYVAELSYVLAWVVALTSPVAALLLIWLMLFRLREALHRLRVLRRAAKWKWKRPAANWPEKE